MLVKVKLGLGSVFSSFHRCDDTSRARWSHLNGCVRPRHGFRKVRIVWNVQLYIKRLFTNVSCYFLRFLKGFFSCWENMIFTRKHNEYWVDWNIIWEIVTYFFVYLRRVGDEFLLPIKERVVLFGASNDIQRSISSIIFHGSGVLILKKFIILRIAFISQDPTFRNGTKCEESLRIIIL